MEGEGSSINAQKLNIPVEAVADTAATEELKTPSEGAPERREDEDAASRSEKKEKEKEDKPRSLAAFKVCLYTCIGYVTTKCVHLVRKITNCSFLLNMGSFLCICLYMFVLHYNVLVT